MTTFDTSLVSDLHKDAYGFRPRGDYWRNWETLSEDQKQAEWDSLMAAADRSAAEEREREDAATVAADAEITRLRELTGGSVADAIRYLHDAYGTDGDDGFLEYHLGTRYGYIAAKRSA